MLFIKDYRKNYSRDSLIVVCRRAYVYAFTCLWHTYCCYW